MRIQQLLPVITFIVISGQMIGQLTKLPYYKNPDKGIEEHIENLLILMTLEVLLYNSSRNILEKAVFTLNN